MAVVSERVTARIEGDFIVFLIGMRINKFWKIHKWWPAARAMTRMLSELQTADPAETGFLGFTNLGARGMVQYWRSFDDLEQYARAQDSRHWPEWVEFNRRMKNARGDVGIWHETYLIRAGEYENVYSGMPRIGLGKVVEPILATGKYGDARSRLRG